MVRYYHYTSTRKAESIKQSKQLKKFYRNIILTTLDPKNYFRNEILRKIYGNNYDAYEFGNMADWVVVVDGSQVNPQKLRQISNDVYEYPEDIVIDPNNVMDKPKCTKPTSGPPQWSPSTDAKVTDQNSDVPKNWCRKPFILPPKFHLSKTFIDTQYADLGECILQKEACVEASENQRLCCICDTNVPTRVMIPCGHDGLCIDCVEKLIKEPKIEILYVNRDGINLYHYTDKSGADAIKAAGFIKQSGSSGAFGAGTYMTDLKPTDFFRDDILKNNYGGIASAFKKRADYVVIVNKNKLDLQKLQKVGLAVTGGNRSIFKYDDEIRVNPSDVCDKPKCIRAT